MAEEGEGLGLEDLDPGSSAVYESIAFNLDQAKNSINEANIASKNTMERIIITKPTPVKSLL